jgi:hypothetical protein
MIYHAGLASIDGQGYQFWQMKPFQSGDTTNEVKLELGNVPQNRLTTP